MAISVSRYEALKRRIEQERKEAERAEGAIAQIKRDLRSGFGCKTIEDAEQMLKRLERDVQADEKELQAKIEELEEKYGDELD
jgi:predicted  nucleic acid-binding Zn-ribbon protein